VRPPAVSPDDAEFEGHSIYPRLPAKQHVAGGPVSPRCCSDWEAASSTHYI
jgi:hypothetical protein